MYRALLLCSLCSLFAFTYGSTAGARTTDVAAIVLKDLNGKSVRPLNARGRRATVLLFIAHDCPISNTYAPEMARIYQSYSKKKIAIYLIYVDPGMKAETARKHVRDYRLPMRALLDPAHKAVKLAGATVTPEAVVFGADGRLVYRGRIDDLYLDFGKRRYETTKHDLREVLNAIVEGKKPPLRTTNAVGCFIPQVK
jgi:peroxiredoxin